MGIVRCAWLFGLLAASSACAQPVSETYKPVAGQPGKDVVWIPTPDATLDAMLDMAQVTPRDFVIDLGSGDGRMVIAAAKRGARAYGVEFNPDLVALSERDLAVSLTALEDDLSALIAAPRGLGLWARVMG